MSAGLKSLSNVCSSRERTGAADPELTFGFAERSHPEPAISLPPIYGWLTGGFDTPDLQEAKYSGS